MKHGSKMDEMTHRKMQVLKKSHEPMEKKKRVTGVTSTFEAPTVDGLHNKPCHVGPRIIKTHLRCDNANLS